MRRATGLLFGLLLSGCAATSGQDWLSSPLEAQEARGPAAVDSSEPVVDARPRLSHTVTLGETYDSPATATGVVGAAPVQVNVTTQVPVVVNNYAGYGYGGFGYGAYGYGSPVSRSAGVPVRSASSSTATKVGADFPAPPDYGPRALK